MNVRKKRTLKNQQIQREQLQLVKIQKELEGILGKVNETINALKVEELQLKANAVTVMEVDTPAVYVPVRHIKQSSGVSTSGVEALLDVADVHEPENKYQPDEEVNQQRINLDIFLHTEKGAGVEEEEDED